MINFDGGGMVARRMARTRAYAFAVVLVSSGAGLYGGTVTWSGLGSQYWHDTVNWTCGFCSPGAGDDVVINNSTFAANKATLISPSTLYPVVSVRTLAIASGFSATVTGSGRLTIVGTSSKASTNAGTLGVDSGTLNIQGVLTNTGTVLQTGASGSVLNVGTSSSATGTINGGTVTGIITNTFGTLNGTTLTSGTAVTGGTITGTTTAKGVTVSGAANTGTFHAAAGLNTWTGGSNSNIMDLTGGTLTIASNFTNTGTVTGATVTGAVANTGGTLSGTTLNAGSSVTNGSIAGTTTNKGTITGSTVSGSVADAGGTLSGTTLNNTSSVTGGIITGATTAKGTTVSGAANTGVFTATAGTNSWSGGSNTNSMTATAGTLSITGPFTNTGTVSHATLSGQITNTSGILDTVSLTGVTLTGGTLQGINTATGTDSLASFANTNTLNITGGTTTLSGKITGGGDINVGPSATVILSNGLQFTGGDLTVSGGTATVQGLVDPLDTFTLDGGTLNLDGTFDVVNAYLKAGAITGLGAFGSGANVFNSGVDFYVGGQGTIGHWTLNSYTQSATGRLFFDILNSGQDSLTLTNGGTLGSNVSVNFNYDGPLKHFTLISGLQSDSGLTFSAALPQWWTYSFNNGNLTLDYAAPDPPTAMLIGGALLALGSLRRRRLGR